MREFERAMAAVQKREARKQVGLLKVALDDLAEAVNKIPGLADVAQTKDVRAILEMALLEAEVACS